MPHQQDRSAPSDEADAVDAAEERLSRRFVELVESGRSVPGFLAQRPVEVLGVVRDLRALPRIVAALPPTAEAASVREQMMRNPTSRRFTLGVTAVLRIDGTPGGYLAGPDRGTVRRKVRSAERRGVAVRAVPQEQRRALLLLADEHERANERAEYRTADPHNDDLLDHGMWFAAYDPDDAPLALAVIPIAGEWATLRYFRTLQPGPASSDARYLMTHVVAEALCERGVRYLVDTARPHWLPNGLRHFQRMVGFRLMRISPVRIAD